MKNLSKTFIFRKTISLILALCTLFYVLPLTVFADSISSASGAENEEEKPSAASGTVGEIIEMTELREEGSKTFRLEDGSYLAAQYKEPVHYLDGDGKWQDIDNTLAASGSEYATSDARIKFTKKVTGGKEIFTLQEGNKKITLSFPEAKRKTVGTVYNGEDGECETELQKKLNLEKLSSRIVYENILEGTDIEYVISSGSIKENIIVKESGGEYSYTFELSLNNLSAALCSDGSISITDKSGAEVVYTIPAPIVFDANSSLAPEGCAHYTLESFGNGKYELTVTVDAEWMNSAERVYPVTVDPTLSKQGTSNIIDTYVSKNEPNADASARLVLRVSKNQYSFLRISSLPSIPDSAYITNATLTLEKISGTGVYIAAIPVTKNWTGSFCWNDYNSSQPYFYENQATDYCYISQDNNEYNWNITQTVINWYSGNNYGLVLKQIVESDVEVAFYSSEATHAVNTTENVDITKPYFTISYIDMNGIEPYYSYLSQSAGATGSGSVNLASGKLTFSIPLISTTDSLMPFTVSAIYNSASSNKVLNSGNSNYAYNTGFMDAGFSLNISETLKPINEGEYYVWTDSDGTEHAFYPAQDSSGNIIPLEFNDESGKNLKLVFSNGQARIIDTATQTTNTYLPLEVYGNGWYLSSITDENNNTIVISTDSQRRPTAISLIPNGSSSIQQINLYYSGTKLRYLVNKNSRYAVELGEDGAYQTFYYANDSVREADWQSFVNGASADNISSYSESVYDFDSNGYLVKVTDPSTKISVNYVYSSDGKVTSIYETGYDSTSADYVEGNRIGITYGATSAFVRSAGSDDIYGNSDDLITVMTFDRYGRKISEYSYLADNVSKIIGATGITYATSENAKNNVTQAFSSGGTYANYVVNGRMVRSKGGWTVSGDVASGSYQLGLETATESKISQVVYLPEGRFTLTVYTTPTYYPANAYVKVEDIYGGFSYVKNIYDSENNGLQSKVATTIEFETGYYEQAVRISICLEGDISQTNRLNINGVTLLSDTGSFEPSMVEEGHGELALYSFDNWKTESGGIVSLSSDGAFGSTMLVNADVTKNKYIRQVIFTASQNDLDRFDIMYDRFKSNAQSYVVSGFGKALRVSYNSKSEFAIMLEVTYYQGAGREDIIKEFPLYFNKSITDWQYVSSVINTAFERTSDDPITAMFTCVKEIAVKCVFSYQPYAYALFDEISVIPSTGSELTKYEYNDYGLVSSVSNGKYCEWYSYTDNKQISSVENSSGEKTLYYYSDTSDAQVSSVEYYTLDADGVYELKFVTEYLYNSYGQCVEVKMSQPQVASSAPMIVSRTLYETTAGSKIFGAVLEETDSSGSSYRYYYDNSTGRLLASINKSDNIGVCYEYDEKGLITSVMPAMYISDSLYSSVNDSSSLCYEYGVDLRIERIDTESTAFKFFYNEFGNLDHVIAGGEILVWYDYNDYNGKLDTVRYNESLAVSYRYDSLDRVSEIWYNNIKAFEYEYTKNGQVSCITDVRNEESTRYLYNSDGTLYSVVYRDEEEKLAYSSSYILYDDLNRPVTLSQTISYPIASSLNSQKSIQYHTVYGSGDLLNAYEIQVGTYEGEISFTYDNYQRITDRVFEFEDFINSMSYEYSSRNQSGDFYTDYYITRYTSAVNEATSAYEYTYDSRGNISSVSLNNSEIYRYSYDEIGQLVREDNIPRNATYIYKYDKAGNITSAETYALTAAGVTPSSPVDTQTYKYYTTSWGDRLSRVNDIRIYYDSIGNPTYYYNGFTYTWEGKRLISAERAARNMTFTYNDEGIRTSKVVDGTETTYYLYGSVIIGESNGTETLMYLYDEMGLPIGMTYYSTDLGTPVVWESYFYERDLLGNITAVYSESGVKLISYEYDAWGNFTTTYHNGGEDTAAALNPFKYRGYYYDADLGFYYLESRYYDQNIRRFISPDEVDFLGVNGDLSGFNLYAYCSNDPVNCVDYSGHFAITTAILIGAAIGFVFGAIVGGSSAYNDAIASGATGWSLVGQTLLGGLGGGLIGAATGAVLGAGVWLSASVISATFGSGMLAGNCVSGGLLVSNEVLAVSGALSIAVLLLEWNQGSWPGDDPTQSPGDGFRWRGPGDVGSSKGEWYNPTTGDQLHPDLNHPLPKGPHWGWKNKVLGILKDIFKP